MRKIIAIITAGIFFISSCKKEYEVPLDLASINVVHAVVNIPTLVVNTSKKEGIWKGLAASNTGKVNYGFLLNNPLRADGNASIAVATLADTLQPLYKSDSKLNIQPGDVYTLFLAGAAGAVEPVLVKEELQQRADSTTGIRFVNLVSNGNTISVNIKNAAGTEVTGLTYKQLTGFKEFDAHKANPSYIFEFKDEVTSTILSTYTFNVARSFNVTLVLRGLLGGTGTNAINITRVNHY